MRGMGDGSFLVEEEKHVVDDDGRTCFFVVVHIPPDQNPGKPEYKPGKTQSNRVKPSVTQEKRGKTQNSQVKRR